MDHSEAPARTSKGGARAAVSFAIQGRKWVIPRIAATAFAGGLLEALFLLTVTRAAFAIAEGKDQIEVAGWDLSLASTLWIAIALALVRSALAGLASWQSSEVACWAVANIRHRLTDAFLNASWEVQQAQRAGSLQELVTTYSNQASGLMASVTRAVVSGANLIAMLGMSFVIDPLGAIGLIVSVIVLSSLLRPLRSVVRRRAKAASSTGMDLAIAVNEVSDLAVELHVFNVQDRALARVGDVIDRSRRANAAKQFASALSTPLYAGLAYLAIVAALAVVAASNSTSLTSIGAVMLVMLRSMGYGQASQGSYLAILSAVPAMEELQSRLDLFDAGRCADRGEAIGRVGPLAMEHVSFAYPRSATILRDVSFTIDPHEVIGIVGPSGAGKSTLVQLLLGLRRPNEGRVLAGGRDIAILDPAEWARGVTFVPQAAHLVTGTIGDNIRFLREGVSDADVERAARLAHLHDDIVNFPLGYEHQVGDKGGELSGGQQQRLSIARALIGHPEVMILDEPTSALDVRSEHLIRSTLLALKDRMTVVVIAHRLSTLSICDRIMVIKDGELKAFGTPDALEETSDFYREALALSGMR
jgi:ABC-type multidrug transport system fused ATPase/permease subunit